MAALGFPCASRGFAAVHGRIDADTCTNRRGSSRTDNCGHGLPNEALNELDKQDIALHLHSVTSITQGRHIHALITRIGLGNDTFLGNLLLGTYDKNHALPDARSVFDHMPIRNVVSWNSMIGAYAKREHYKEALQLFCQMQLESVEPDNITFLSLLTSCTIPSALPQGKMLHACIINSGFHSDVVLGNALVNMYGKCGALEIARSVFDKMHQRSVVTWNVMISRYTQLGQCKEALQLYQEMCKQGLQPSDSTFVSTLGACAILAALTEGRAIHSDIVESGFELDVATGTALIHLYGKCGCSEDARLVFDEVRERDVAMWSAMISAYSQKSKEARQLFREMQKQGIEPDKISFINLLGTCDVPADLEEYKVIHASIVESGFDLDIVIGNALVHMYGKCGALESACLVFNKMQQRDVISWNALVAAYSQYGNGNESFQLLHDMRQEGVKPDEVTFVCLLSACSRTGSVEEGHRLFSSMIEEHGIEPELEHYSCMVDLLGRAGHLDWAEDVITTMPLQPDAQVWVTLLGACRLHGDSERGERAAECILHLSPQNTAAHVLLSNVYALD